MKLYEGTKRLSAKPMTLGEYNAYRGFLQPEDQDPNTPGYLVEYVGGGKANDSRHAGYISWSPADVFERTYKEATHGGATVDHLVEAKITGTRPLADDEAALINEVKAHAEQTRELVGRVRRYLDQQGEKPLPEGHAPHSQATSPWRWAALAQTDLQTGFMKLVRAVAQPTTF